MFQHLFSCISFNTIPKPITGNVTPCHREVKERQRGKRGREEGFTTSNTLYFFWAVLIHGLKLTLLRGLVYNCIHHCDRKSYLHDNHCWFFLESLSKELESPSDGHWLSLFRSDPHRIPSFKSANRVPCNRGASQWPRT